MSEQSGPPDGPSDPPVEQSDPPVEPVRAVEGSAIAVRGNDIDTDQIVPARFLKAVTFDGLGQAVFFDQRYENDEPLEHPFNDPAHRDASVLVVNANFGCGSSREHAPQALQRWGIDAVVGESFAEIFAGNCLALGVPTVTMPADEVEALQSFAEDHPDAEVTVDVAGERVAYDGRSVDAAVDDAQRRALVDGTWDTTSLLLANADAVRETAESLPYVEAADLPERG